MIRPSAVVWGVSVNSTTVMFSGRNARCVTAIMFARSVAECATRTMFNCSAALKVLFAPTISVPITSSPAVVESNTSRNAPVVVVRVPAGNRSPKSTNRYAGFTRSSSIVNRGTTVCRRTVGAGSQRVRVLAMGDNPRKG